MCDQPQADESLPTPTPDETARLMREGSQSKVPAWKRLLPPWAFSIGLHLFVLPFVLGLTVVFADSLFVPTAWNDGPDEKGDDVPYSLMIEDRDLPVEQVQEKAVPITKATDPDGKAAAEIRGKVIMAQWVAQTRTLLVQVLVGDASGSKAILLHCPEDTQVFREVGGGDSHRTVKISVRDILSDTSVRVLYEVQDGKNVAKVVAFHEFGLEPLIR